MHCSRVLDLKRRLEKETLQEEKEEMAIRQVCIHSESYYFNSSLQIENFAEQKLTELSKIS
jgi:hypothetical protein